MSKCKNFLVKNIVGSGYVSNFPNELLQAIYFRLKPLHMTFLHAQVAFNLHLQASKYKENYMEVIPRTLI